MATTRKLTKSSRTLVLSIPKSIIKKYGWKEKQKMSIKDAGRVKIEIRDWKRK